MGILKKLIEKLFKASSFWWEQRWQFFLGVKSDLIMSVAKNSDDYEEKYMKIKFKSDDELPLNKTTEVSNMITVVRAIFLENNKYYPQAFLDEYSYKV